MASEAKQTVVTGATVLLKIDGATVGRAQSIDPRVTFGTEGVYEIGSIMPQEHVQNRYEGTFTLERYMLRETDLAHAGYIGLGEDILQKDIIDIEVINKLDNKTLRVYRGCTFSDYTNTIRANAIAGENATVQYLSCDMGK
ncbi:hypothetical protein [Peptoniphilus sp. HCN-40583]|uniref:hypothetical protein n=1 Tax=Peptoniphilus sp. HCN-40583 TaxID=3134662 RepID=UPI0030C5EC8D